MVNNNNENIIMTRGDTLQYAFELEPEDDEDVITLTGAYFTCRNESDTIVFQKSLNDGITLIEDNKYQVRVAPEDTASLDIGYYKYDNEITYGDDKLTILKGTLKLEEDITR